MDDLVRNLPHEARVLDLGAGAGSFGYESTDAIVIAVDLDFPTQCQNAEGRMIGRSEALPLSASSFDVVVCNHTLEHFELLREALFEISRILKDGGHLWVAVPDGFCLDDTLYRFLFEGGGHVNRFTLQSLIDEVEAATRLRALSFKKLYTGFVYLNPPDAEKLQYYPRRARILGKIPPAFLEFMLRWLNFLTRSWDRVFRSNTSQYGWGVVFQAIPRESDPSPRSTIQSLSQIPRDVNVCFSCGAGHPRETLRDLMKKSLFWTTYTCPCCGKINFYSKQLDGGQ